VKRQRWPARSAARGWTSAASSWKPAYQPSASSGGTPAGAPPSSIAKRKRSPLALLRQAGDDAGDDDVLALEGGRQRIGEPQLCLPARRCEACGERADDADERNGAPRERARCERARCEHGHLDR